MARYFLIFNLRSSHFSYYCFLLCVLFMFGVRLSYHNKRLLTYLLTYLLTIVQHLDFLLKICVVSLSVVRTNLLACAYSTL